MYLKCLDTYSWMEFTLLSVYTIIYFRQCLKRFLLLIGCVKNHNRFRQDSFSWSFLDKQKWYTNGILNYALALWFIKYEGFIVLTPIWKQTNQELTTNISCFFFTVFIFHISLKTNLLLNRDMSCSCRCFSIFSNLTSFLHILTAERQWLLQYCRWSMWEFCLRLFYLPLFPISQTSQDRFFEIHA